MKSRIKYFLIFLIISLAIQNVFAETNLNNINNIENLKTNKINKDINGNIEEPKIQQQKQQQLIISNSGAGSNDNQISEELLIEVDEYQSNSKIKKETKLLNSKRNSELESNRANNNQLSDKTNQQKTLAFDILYFEVGILVVFVFSIYFINQRKKKILNENNEKLSKYLNKV
ncbi:hypothetical protein DICPUDRAFT_98548 [Dictyostelium purpureum]|uniref:Transmembrane protein n=1 Tax=Dictyostelium purpureum TaxID=5786 RepID=F0ZRE9_DICPU|nr:uncharacterized protein DICPUDRAFT_98548 [Dictyostelium purpureum]EGC33479.1 hypothetical protein DICPUDRAFT_98548 [Dictyostelium purpureum]|eukprot:XP_003290002.1 hypothetical protein DICPUDRAFT_98548 [Dictyostelium purpureum]